MQYDLWCAASIAQDDGDLFEHNSVCICMQPIEQDHRTLTIEMRNPPILPAYRRASGAPTDADNGGRKG